LNAHYKLNQEDLPFWLDLAARKGDAILELGCGSGRVLLGLAQAGYRVLGLDRDMEMLKFLRRNTPADLVRQVDIFQADMTAFHLGKQFELIILPCNTYSMLSSAQREAALTRVRQHLQPDGLFVASVPNPGLLRRLPRRSDPEIEETFPHPLDGEPVQVSSAWERTPSEFRLTWIYDHLQPDGQVERFTAHANHTLAGVSAYREELSRAGMYLEAQFGDFNNSPYKTDSSNYIFIARKS
jgi:SAM-dependent methyltransferase